MKGGRFTKAIKIALDAALIWDDKLKSTISSISQHPSSSRFEKPTIENVHQRIIHNTFRPTSSGSSSTGRGQDRGQRSVTCSQFFHAKHRRLTIHQLCRTTVTATFCSATSSTLDITLQQVPSAAPTSGQPSRPLSPPRELCLSKPGRMLSW